MRYFMRFLIIMFLVPLIIWIPPGHAMDAMLGTVLSIAPEKGEIYVSTKNSEKVLVSFAPDQMPYSIQPGEKIRFWGNFQTDDFQTGDFKQFNATYIQKSRLKHKYDHTGVRSRLHRGIRGARDNRGMGRNNRRH